MSALGSRLNIQSICSFAKWPAAANLGSLEPIYAVASNLDPISFSSKKKEALNIMAY